MLKDENIIVFSSADWKIGPTSPEHISTNFAKGNRVLFIETFGSRFPAFRPEHIKRVFKRIINWFRGIKEQYSRQGRLYIYSPINLMVSYKFCSFINRIIFLKILKRLIKKLKMENPILYFYLPPPPGIMGNLNEKAIIYHCVDEWSTFGAGKNKDFLEAERRLIEDADAVITANRLLYEKKKPYARRIYQIYHGVDYDHFTKEFDKDIPLPPDIKAIPKPIIAIIGAFADWMDIDLIKFIAQTHKKWSIVSIGPVESGIDINSLSSLGNIYFLGPKVYSELPNYYRAVDVFIIPFLLNEHIKYCSPIRLYEHLASGKPVVATDFPAAREIGQGLIYIALSRQDFVKKIEQALIERDTELREKRKELAKSNTWEARIEEISEIIKEVLRK